MWLMRKTSCAPRNEVKGRSLLSRGDQASYRQVEEEKIDHGRKCRSKWLNDPLHAFPTLGPCVLLPVLAFRTTRSRLAVWMRMSLGVLLLLTDGASPRNPSLSMPSLIRGRWTTSDIDHKVELRHLMRSSTIAPARSCPERGSIAIFA